MVSSALRHSSSVRILRASASASLALAFFLSIVANCDVAAGCCVLAFVLDLVALRFAGGLRPAAPVPSAPLDDIPGAFVYVWVQIFLSLLCSLKMYENVTVNYSTCFTVMWRK